jgi:hypothetical protein
MSEIIYSNQEKAIVTGSNKYNGKPCKKCGETLRYIGGSCIKCKKERQKLPKYKEYFKEYQKLPKYKWKNRENHLKNLYGLTPEDYNNMVLESNNSCSICNETFIKTPHVDHDHITGKIRGLLCHNCNAVLGNAKDNPQILINAAEYLNNCIKCH